MVAIIPDNNGDHLGVIREGNKLQVFRLHPFAHPQVFPIAVVNPDFSVGTPAAELFIPASYWWGWSSGATAVNYDRSSRQLIIPSGLSGVCSGIITDLVGARLPAPAPEETASRAPDPAKRTRRS